MCAKTARRYGWKRSSEGMYNASGALVAMQGVSRDITERKRAEEELRTSRLHLAEAMDLAHIVYWEFDLAAETYVFNDPFYAFYGTTAEREGGYRMTREEYAKRFVHPDDLPLYYEFVRARCFGIGLRVGCRL